jgi:hypothetical protein
VFEFPAADEYIQMMKRVGKIVICLAAVLALNASLRADDALPTDELALNDGSSTDTVVLPGNPYAPIVVRNVFDLTPVPPVDPDAQVAQPPLKITPNGIMSIFGHLQVLFKVTGKPDGKEDSYILMTGQRQDNIEVTKIDEQNGIVTFNNNGIVQKLPLVAAVPSSTGGTPTPFGGGIPSPAFNPNNGNGNGNPGGGFGRFGQRGGRARGGQNAPGGNNLNNNGDTDGGGDTLNLRSVPTRTYQPEDTGLSPEETAITIEAQRELYRSQNNPVAGLLPPTAITPPDAAGPTGEPLIALPPTPGN